MRSLRNDQDRNALVWRLQALNPEAKGRWGRLDARGMVCHLRDAMAMGLGDMAVKPGKKTPFQHFPLKHLVIYVLPFPKNVPTAGELLATKPGDFESDKRGVLEQIERVAAAPKGIGPAHPFFGPLNNEEWNALQWKHIDHHLKQFGC